MVKCGRKEVNDLKSAGLTSDVLDAIIKLADGSVESAVTLSDVRTIIPALEANYLWYLVSEKYLTNTYKNGEPGYVLLPKALDYVASERQQQKRDRLLWISLLFAAIAATPVILQAVKLLLLQIQ